MAGGNFSTHAIHNAMNTAAHAGVEHSYHLIGGGIGLASIASTAINVIKYINLRSDLCDIYRDEIASKLGKAPEKITVKDMDALAQGVPEKGIPANKALAEELDNLRQERNIGIGVTVVSIMLAIPLAISVMSGLGLPMVALGALFTAPTLPLLGSFATQLGIGFLSHKLLEYPIEKAGHQLFSVANDTTHERIESLMKDREDGKALTKEQVLGVFVGAKQEFSNFVESSFGKSYDKLDLKQKQSLTESFEQYLPLTNITASLNAGITKVSELAFAVQGDKSGVAMNMNPTAPNLSLKGKIHHAVHNVAEHLQHEQHNEQSLVKTKVSHDFSNYENHPAHQQTSSFADKLKPQVQRTSFVDRVTAPPSADFPISPTIH